jgi:hypothetical protein
MLDCVRSVCDVPIQIAGPSLDMSREIRLTSHFISISYSLLQLSDQPEFFFLSTLP